MAIVVLATFAGPAADAAEVNGALDELAGFRPVAAHVLEANPDAAHQQVLVVERAAWADREAVRRHVGAVWHPPRG